MAHFVTSWQLLDKWKQRRDHRSNNKTFYLFLPLGRMHPRLYQPMESPLQEYLLLSKHTLSNPAPTTFTSPSLSLSLPFSYSAFSHLRGAKHSLSMLSYKSLLLCFSLLLYSCLPALGCPTYPPLSIPPFTHWQISCLQIMPVQWSLPHWAPCNFSIAALSNPFLFLNSVQAYVRTHSIIILLQQHCVLPFLVVRYSHLQRKWTPSTAPHTSQFQNAKGSFHPPSLHKKTRIVLRQCANGVSVCGAMWIISKHSRRDESYTPHYSCL